MVWAVKSFSALMALRWTAGEDSLLAIAAEAGFTGEIGKWDGKGARDSINMMLNAAQTGRIRLDCHCMPKECHTQVIGKILKRNT